MYFYKNLMLPPILHEFKDYEKIQLQNIQGHEIYI
jgi:hypothetical protein